MHSKKSNIKTYRLLSILHSLDLDLSGGAGLGDFITCTLPVKALLMKPLLN